MAAKGFPPLNQNSPIVDKDGKPTTDFLLLVNQLLKTKVDDASVIAQDALDIANTALSEADALGMVDIIAGTGIDGGGLLGAGDVTLDLADTTVAPGTYGDATHSARVTIDQQGRVTAASQVAIAGGGGGGGLVPARFWRIRGLAGQSGHSGDGMGFMGINWRDSGGTALIGSGTPLASRTDGSWNLGQGFDGDVTSNGHGWYSGNGDGAVTGSMPWVGYDFGVGVTVLPHSVEFAPLHAFTWTVPAQVAHDYSQDGEIWHLAMLVNNRAGASGVVESYVIS